MRRATLLPSAKADLLEIFSYIAIRSQSVRVAQKFDKKMRAHLNHLASLPFQIGRNRPDLHPDLRSSAFLKTTSFSSDTRKAASRS